jgi:hypothetical protein
LRTKNFDCAITLTVHFSMGKRRSKNRNWWVRGGGEGVIWHNCLISVWMNHSYLAILPGESPHEEWRIVHHAWKDIDPTAAGDDTRRMRGSCGTDQLIKWRAGWCRGLSSRNLPWGIFRYCMDAHDALSVHRWKGSN